MLLSVGAPGLARQLGLEAILADAQRKVMTAMSARTVEGANRPRFHLDLGGWGQEDRAAPPCLPDIARAVLDRHRIGFIYRRGHATAEKEWMADPLGLVMKAGAWYLVARPVGSDSPLVYRLSRITTASVLPESSDAPEAFDLAAFWESQARAYEKTFESVHVTVRLPRALHWRVRAQQVGTERPESADTLVVDLNLEGIDDAVSYLLVLGADLEVLAPPSMRDAVTRQVHRLARLYGGTAPG